MNASLSCACGCGCDGHCQGACACGGACARPVLLAAPQPRPGLDQLAVRIGDHGSFFAAAAQALSSPAAPALRALATRDPSDPAIALIDAWSMAADILTFYRERLTNEGYLRCARDPRSLRWLAGQVGYRPRPGVAASTWLAYLMDANAAPVTIAAGAKAQSTPLGGQDMQTYETLEALEARCEWSAMAARTQRIPEISIADSLSRARIRLRGVISARPGERVLFAFGYGQMQQVAREVAEARVDARHGWTELALVPRAPAELALKLMEVAKELDQLASGASSAPERSLAARAGMVLTSFLLGGAASDALALCDELSGSPPKAPKAKALAALCAKLLAVLAAPVPSLQLYAQAIDIDRVLERVASAPAAVPRSAADLKGSVVAGLAASGAARGALLKQAAPAGSARLYQAWRAMPAQSARADNAPEVFLLRVMAGAYGAAAVTRNLKEPKADWQLAPADAAGGAAYLDNQVSNLARASLALVDVPLAALPGSAGLGDAAGVRELARITRLARIASSQVAARSDYASNLRVTRLDLVDAGSGAPFQVVDADNDNLGIGGLRQVAYTLQSEALTLDAEPIEAAVEGQRIELDSLLEDLHPGRWIIVKGERLDIVTDQAALPGIIDGELALVAAVEQQAYPQSPGDSLHTVLVLESALAYRYRRRSVTVYGNVVKATHGESGAEILGSGQAAARLQRFELRRGGLTFVPAPTVEGVRGSQQVRVNNVEWLQVDSLLDAGAAERVYEMDTDAAGVARFTFGDGVHGARLPTGQGNLRASYRSGIGAAGNAGAERINQLATRPLGINSVLNPLPATGGADRDSAQQIRSNAALAALSLAPQARLVSVADYAWFARRYAGIGQAVAHKVLDGGACVQVTLAGVDDGPLRAGDALLASLRQAYLDFGDPSLPVLVEVRELLALFIQASVAVIPGHEWETVEAELRRRLLEVFSFGRRQLGQDVYLSEVSAAIQAVAGVDWVDIDVLGAISETALRDKDALAAAVAALQQQITPGPVATRVKVRGAAVNAAPLASQLAYLLPAVAGTLVLNQHLPR